MAERTPRDLDTRIEEKRTEEDTWLPPSTLPEIRQVPGRVHRWVRIMLMNEPDPRNASMRFREGWEPCKAIDYPELKMFSEGKTRYPDTIEIGGLLLCSAPEAKMKAREKYYQDLNARQMQAVESQMDKEIGDPRTGMRGFRENSTKVKFGKGAADS